MAVNEKQAPQVQDMQTRRRWTGVNVAISILVAAALLVVVNVVTYLATADRPMRWNVESLGRYRLSDSAQKILDQVKNPVKVTAIYTSTDPERKPEEYLPALRDLLDEMHQLNPEVTVVNIANDVGKGEVVNRLRKQLEEKTGEHRQLIADFQKVADVELPLLEKFAQTWRDYPADGWLAQFGVPKSLETLMTGTVDDFRKLTGQVRTMQNQSTLPDYSELVNNVTDALRKIKTERLERIRSALRDLAAMPEKAQKLQPELTKNIQGFNDEVAKAMAALAPAAASAPSSASQPSDPGETLARFAAACRQASAAAEGVARNLDALAEGPGYIRLTSAWRVEGGELPEMYRNIGQLLLMLGEQAQGMRTRAKTEVQAEFAEKLRGDLPKLNPLLKTGQESVEKLLKDLSTQDDATRAIFEQARKEEYFKDLIDPLGNLLDRAGKLPLIVTQTDLIERIKQDNIVLIETADKKLGVVTFDEIWPVANRSPSEAASGEAPKRVFYGDMAISGKMLALTRPQLAEVVFACFEDVPPQQLWQQQPPVVGAMPTIYLVTLRDRLAKANLEVTEWNLHKQKDPPPPKEGRKQVLIVLPFPGPQNQNQNPAAPPEAARPEVKPEDMERVTKLIDAGMPAIFLTGYTLPQYSGQPPMRYEWNDYLSKNWNLEVKLGYRVLQAQRDPDSPGKYTLPLSRWDWMPLSNFTHNPVGDPLRARRFYWVSTSPVVPAKGDNPSIIEDILYVPSKTDSGWDMWAAAQPKALLQKLLTGQSAITPEPEDMKPPFGLITESRRKIDGKANSVIVMSVGMAFFDEYLTQRIPQIKGESITTEPPPVGDVDVLTNSVYYLSDNKQFMGAGPVLVQPIDLIDRTRMMWIQALFAGAWPAVMLAAGGLVMLRRWR